MRSEYRRIIDITNDMDFESTQFLVSREGFEVAKIESKVCLGFGERGFLNRASDVYLERVYRRRRVCPSNGSIELYACNRIDPVGPLRLIEDEGFTLEMDGV